MVKNYQLSYTKPWINSNGDSLGASIFNRVYKYDDYNADGDTIAEYDKRRKGWNLTWGRVSDEYRTNYLNFESVKDPMMMKTDSSGEVVRAKRLPLQKQNGERPSLIISAGRTA